MSATAGDFAAVAVALYAAHHVGDYWVQTDEQARRKGDAGKLGAQHCLVHVLSYVLTQLLFLGALMFVTDVHIPPLGLGAGMLISGVTHYLADRREHGLMFKLARALPGKAAFLKLGVPRPLVVECQATDQPGTFLEHLDNPTLGTGAWALDQAWHIFFGVFVAALVIVGLS